MRTNFKPFLAVLISFSVLAPSAHAIRVGNGIRLNGISQNALHQNRLSPNGINQNGLHQNRLAPNGIHSNGITRNGFSQNGPHSQGIRLNGPRTQSFSLNGRQQQGIALNENDNQTKTDQQEIHGFTLEGVEIVNGRLLVQQSSK